MTETMSPERRRLLYRAMHRGLKEADLVVGKFAAARLPEMSEAEVAAFARLLDVPDQELFAWIIGRADVPAEHDGPVFRQMQAFDVATALREG